MILYNIDLGTIKETFSETVKDNYIVIGNIQEIDSIFSKFGMDKKLINEVNNSIIPKLESYRDMDYIYVYDIDSNTEKGNEYWLFLRKQGLIMICKDENELKRKFLKNIEEKQLGSLSIEKLLAIFLNQLVMDDVGLVRSLEEEIEQLEENILISKPKAANLEIIVMKKRLLFLRHYYEQLLEVAWDIEENDNRLINDEDMKSFGMFTGRLERITKSMVMLRDYLTQVREAYQAQEDIRLNETMEIFTVITAIFLPLTLLTSWYGMNFKYMPELEWHYGYFGVFVIAIVIVVAMWSYFKKRNMFR